MRTVDDVLASFPAGSVTMLPAGDVALLVAEVERLRARLAEAVAANDAVKAMILRASEPSA